MSIFYFGARPDAALTRMLSQAGHGVVQLQFSHGILDLQSCAAVVLHWRSKADQQVIREARSIGLPVVVLTHKLAAAFRAGEPFADIYLEEPSSHEEITTVLCELIAANQRRLARPTAKTVAA